MWTHRRTVGDQTNPEIRLAYLLRCRRAARRGDVDKRGRATMAAYIGSDPRIKQEIREAQAKLRRARRPARRYSRDWDAGLRPTGSGRRSAEW